MPTFDVVSEVDMQEVKNAVDQASREIGARFDFKDNGSSLELAGSELHLQSSTEDKMVKRSVSLKALDYGKVEEASKGTVRQTVALQAGISGDKARTINKFI